MPAEDNPVAAERRPPITVVLVDDEPLIRVALAQAFASSGLELVGEAATGEDALELVVDVRPDVVLMDLQLAGMSGVRAIELLGLLAPTSRVLVLTRSEQNRVVEAIIAGACGYILKSAPVDAITAPSERRPPENRCCPRRSPASFCSAFASRTSPSGPALSPRSPSGRP